MWYDMQVRIKKRHKSIMIAVMEITDITRIVCVFIIDKIIGIL